MEVLVRMGAPMGGRDRSNLGHAGRDRYVSFHRFRGKRLARVNERLAHSRDVTGVGILDLNLGNTKVTNGFVVYKNNALHSLSAYFILSLATSLLTTGLIVARILLIHRWTRTANVNRPFNQGYARIIEMLVESAAIYSAALVAHVVLAWSADGQGSLDDSQTFLPQFAVRLFETYFWLPTCIDEHTLSGHRADAHNLPRCAGVLEDGLGVVDDTQRRAARRARLCVPADDVHRRGKRHQPHSVAPGVHHPSIG